MADEMRVEGEVLPRSANWGGARPASGRPSQQAARVAFLKANPGKWCRLREEPVEGGGRVRLHNVRRYCRALPVYSNCELTVRTVDGKCVLFGRYTPPAAEAA
jgi:hypothetical protein